MFFRCDNRNNTAGSSTDRKSTQGCTPGGASEKTRYVCVLFSAGAVPEKVSCAVFRYCYMCKYSTCGMALRNRVSDRVQAWVKYTTLFCVWTDRPNGKDPKALWRSLCNIEVAADGLGALYQTLT